MLIFIGGAACEDARDPESIQKGSNASGVDCVLGAPRFVVEKLPSTIDSLWTP